jgi:dihydrofolate reductase
VRRIVGGVFQSLDGVIQAPGGPTEDPTGGFQHGGWLPQFFDEEVGRAIDRLFAQPYDLLLGRRTYEIFAAYWPYVGRETTDMGETFERAGSGDGDADAAAMGDAFTQANKYVLTRGTPDLGWANSHRIEGLESLRALKQGEGADMIVQGSSTLYPQLLAEGLIDQLTVMTFPVVLGEGKRLFGDGTPARSLRMTDSKVTPNGAVIATYEPGDAPEHGWAGPQTTSARETERQRRMAEGSW